MMQTLQSYRIYKLTGRGHITGGTWIDAASDDEAKRSARAMCDEGTRRWKFGTRLIGRVPCDDACD